MSDILSFFSSIKNSTIVGLSIIIIGLGIHVKSLNSDIKEKDNTIKIQEADLKTKKAELDTANTKIAASNASVVNLKDQIEQQNKSISDAADASKKAQDDLQKQLDKTADVSKKLQYQIYQASQFKYSADECADTKLILSDVGN